MLHTCRTTGLRLLVINSNFTVPKCRSMMGQRKSLSNADENLNRISSTVISGLLAIGAFTYYRTKVKMEERLKDCEYLPEDENYKITNVKFVSYQGCVLSEEMVKSGTMEKIKSFKARPGDVFVASFPKSGTTWVQEVVYQLYLNQCSKEVRQLKDPTEKKDSLSTVDCKEIMCQADSVMETRFPYLEHVYPGIKEIERRKGGRLIKTHLPVHLLPPSVFESGSKVIYIYRNPKDVVVSYYHFARMLTFINYRGTFYDFIVQFLKSRVPYCPYFPHLFGYFDKSESSPKSVLILCYEDMKQNPGPQIEKIAKFLGIELQPEETEQVAANTSFAAMKANPTTNYQHWDGLGLRDKNETSFMRKGEVGDHKNFLDPDFDEAFVGWMNKACTDLKRSLPDFKFELSKSEERSPPLPSQNESAS